mmetsp:Transcript_14084/g.35515  ORF Transcript_14084/g.35515 Transcript_14084/m.35515 type:complete len:216 (+) Transcript_14084:342-989(+)
MLLLQLLSNSSRAFCTSACTGLLNTRLFESYCEQHDRQGAGSIRLKGHTGRHPASTPRTSWHVVLVLWILAPCCAHGLQMLSYSSSTNVQYWVPMRCSFASTSVPGMSACICFIAWPILASISLSSSSDGRSLSNSGKFALGNKLFRVTMRRAVSAGLMMRISGQRLAISTASLGVQSSRTTVWCRHRLSSVGDRVGHRPSSRAWFVAAAMVTLE